MWPSVRIKRGEGPRFDISVGARPGCTGIAGRAKSGSVSACVRETNKTGNRAGEKLARCQPERS